MQNESTKLNYTKYDSNSEAKSKEEANLEITTPTEFIFILFLLLRKYLIEVHALLVEKIFELCSRFKEKSESWPPIVKPLHQPSSLLFESSNALLYLNLISGMHLVPSIHHKLCDICTHLLALDPMQYEHLSTNVS